MHAIPTKRTLIVVLSATVVSAALLWAGFATAGPGVTTDKSSTQSAQFKSPGKLSAPVRVEHTLAAKPVLGLPVELRLVVTCEADCAALSLSFNATDGMTLDRGPESVPLGATKAGDSREFSLWVTPGQQGRHYVNVLVRADVAGAPGMRAVAIPIQLGEPGARKASVDAAVRTGSDGRRLRVMRARDTAENK